MATCPLTGTECGQPGDCLANGCFAEKARSVNMQGPSTHSQFIPYDSVEQREFANDDVVAKGSLKVEREAFRFNPDKMADIAAGRLGPEDSSYGVTFAGPNDTVGTADYGDPNAATPPPDAGWAVGDNE